jgi:squalene-associated FAD-dependent desaturase
MSKGPTSGGKVHVIGAGLAGLSAAVSLARAGVGVEVSDSAAQAGGRCRSYFDPQLGAVIDNGNHLVMSGNRAVNDYLKIIGAGDRLAGPDKAAFDFIDLPTGERWTVRPNPSAFSWWVLAPSRRVPGTKAADYLALAGLLYPKAGLRVDQAIRCQGAVWRRLMEPFLLAALNTKPEGGSAALASAVVRETLAKGGDAYRPRIAEPTLAAAFVDPALAYIEAHGGSVKIGRRLRSMAFDDDRVATLAFTDGEVEVEPTDRVILATPPWTAQDLVPNLSAPDRFCAIVNGHFKIAPPPGAPAILGVIGGTVEWIFAFDDRVSVTISGADHLVDLDRQVLAERLWAEVAAVLGMPATLPPWQIVKEKRATFAATVEQDAKRPAAKTAWTNLILGGDWTQTGLPATIEGAIRSGFKAADLAMRAASV